MVTVKAILDFRIRGVGGSCLAGDECFHLINWLSGREWMDCFIFRFLQRFCSFSCVCSFYSFLQAEVCEKPNGNFFS